MITDTDIATMLAAAEPEHRAQMQRLVDRIRFAEGGGIRKILGHLNGNRDTTGTYMGIPFSELTRDELTALLHFQWRGKL